MGCHFEESTHMFSSYYDSGICLNNVKCLPVSIIVHDGNRVNRHEPNMEPVVEKTTTSCQMQTNNLSVYRTSETLVVSSASSSSSSFTRHTCTSDVVSSTVEYSVGSDDSESNGDTVAVSFLSAPETSMPVKKPYRESRGKMRFKKFFEPLRRSHSAGNPKDSPKMFYSSKYPTHKQDEDDQESVDTGRGSMEPLGDEQEEKTSKLGKEPKKKSLTAEVKEKLYVLRHRYSNLSLSSSKDNKQDRAIIELARNWATSFECLLADKYGVQCLRQFLKSEFSDENIEFWIACEEYKTLKPNKMAAQAQRIFSEFIQHQAPREINIDSRTRDVTYANMDNPDIRTFDAAQRRIQALMDKDSYPRFLESHLYHELLRGQQPSPVSP